jgi:hypothetical protein
MPAATGQTTTTAWFWCVYHIKGTPAKFVGIIDNAPDAKTSIAPDQGIQGAAQQAQPAHRASAAGLTGGRPESGGMYTAHGPAFPPMPAVTSRIYAI